MAGFFKHKESDSANKLLESFEPWLNQLVGDIVCGLTVAQTNYLFLENV